MGDATNRQELLAERAAQQQHYWDAFDQGRLAYFDGTPREQNPHKLYDGYFHMNMADWYRGWDAAQEAAA